MTRTSTSSMSAPHSPICAPGDAAICDAVHVVHHVLQGALRMSPSHRMPASA
jgi:hypothetical protein